MHGFIYIEFEKFVIETHGYAVWKSVLDKNQLTDRVYETANIYSDNEIKQLIQSVAEETGMDVSNLLEKFGIAVVPNLMKVYRAYINPEWRTMDLLEFTESNMHTAVRQSTRGAAPPVLFTSRPRPNEVVIEYVSGRNMVEFGVGLIKGIADYFQETSRIQIHLQKDVAPGKSLITVRYH